MRKRKKTPRHEALGMLISDITVLNSLMGADLTVKVTPESQTGEVGIRVSTS